MKQDRKALFRTIVVLASIVLCLVALAFFVVAVFSNGNKIAPHQEDVKVQIYLNDNDSIIDQLQQNVSRLTKIVESFQEDTLIIKRFHSIKQLQ